MPIFLALVLLSPLSFILASELPQVETSARPLGMGNSYVSIVRDSDALFYNPAGLGFDKGVYWTIADPRAGLNGTDSLTSVQNFQSSSDFATALSNLQGKRIWAGGGGKSVFRVPFVALGAYTNFDASLAIDNAGGPMEVRYINDTVYTIGFGANILPFTYFGVAAKQVRRTGSAKTYTAAEIAAPLTQSQFDADILNPQGEALGFDVGLTFAIDTIVAPAISIVGKNVGGLSFDSSNSAGTKPADVAEEWIAGASMVTNLGIISISPTVDIKHLTDSDIDFDRKTHIGLEVGVPFLDIRGGLHQRYWTAGLGLGLGPLQVDLASWGVNVGDNDNAIEDRRYMAQVTIEFGLGLDIFGSGKSSARNSRGGKGSHLRKARRRIKVRR